MILQVIRNSSTELSTLIHVVIHKRPIISIAARSSKRAMLVISEKPKAASVLYKSLLRFTSLRGEKTNAMNMLMMIAGLMVETSLVFDQPDEAACGLLEKLSKTLRAKPNTGSIGYKALPPAHVIDQDIEKGRAIARDMFEEWSDCSFSFADLLLDLTHDIMITWECEGFRRSEMLRLLSECLYRGLAYEIAAQELCDMVVEKKAIAMQWTLAESISALSAVAGHKSALAESACQVTYGYMIPEELDNIIYTMTQEAVRLGVPAGSSWRFGLAANDVPVSAPYELIEALEPFCDSFFTAIQMDSPEDQAVACAKAAGRMLAVTAGGELPEIEPAIAKPLAMAAITDTYKSVCMERTMLAN